MLASDPRISTTAIQTVGSKGYDGFSIAIENEGRIVVNFAVTLVTMAIGMHD
jgi:hypothetical protein